MQNKVRATTTQTYFRTNMAMEESRTDEELREDLTRLSDEVLRLETSVTTLQDSLLQMGDKVKEVGTLKDTVMVNDITTTYPDIDQESCFMLHFRI